MQSPDRITLVVRPADGHTLEEMKSYVRLEACVQLGNGLARMMVQGRHPQLPAKAHAVHSRRPLHRFLGLGGTVEPVDIQDGT